MSLERRHKDIAIRAAIKAGEAILEVYEGAFEVTFKGDDSPITLADKRANTIIVAALEGTKLPILSEESPLAPYEERKHWDSCWIVDPLDGTKEFVNRNGDFTVNIAYIKEGQPLFGVIYIPVTCTLYVGDVLEKKVLKMRVEDAGIAMDTAFAKAEMFTSRKGSPSPSKIRVATSRSHINKATEAYIERLEATFDTVTYIARGSSLKFCLLAEGKIDVYPRFSPTMEWDTAAGQAICNAVGVEVMNCETGEAMVYNREEMRNSSFVAGKDLKN